MNEERHPPPFLPALVLFDVDGTLLITQGATSRCIHRACRTLFGDDFRWEGVTVGTLDQHIFADLCAANGITDAAPHLAEYKQVYLRILEDELARIRNDIIVLPGVRELLARLGAIPNVTMGIVSGNFRRAIELKLEFANIDAAHFPVMACAEDGDSRLDLPLVAMAEYASMRGGPIPADRVFIIGDTPRDIECARACAAKVISVATGKYDEAALDHGDLILPDLSDTKNVLKFIRRR